MLYSRPCACECLRSHIPAKARHTGHLHANVNHIYDSSGQRWSRQSQLNHAERNTNHIIFPWATAHSMIDLPLSDWKSKDDAKECHFNRLLFEQHLLNLTKSCSSPLPPCDQNNTVFVSEHCDSLPPSRPSYFIVFFSHPINHQYTSNHLNIPLVQIYGGKCLLGE